MTTTIATSNEDSPVAETSRLATALRWLGGLAVLGAGSVFMLQGFDNIGAELRNWSVMVLILACAGTAFLTQRLFADAKGARLLFGLAVLLVPVQFSQVGGMLHELMAPGSQVNSDALGMLSQWLPTLGSPAAMLLTVVGTLFVGVLVARAGFTVLVRDLARPLTLYLSVFAVMLLIPARDSVLGVLVLAGLAAGYFGALRLLNHRQPLLQTFEGRSALALLALPLVIASVRFALHAESLGALCAMVGVTSVLLVELPRRLVGPHLLATLLALIGLIGSALAWSVYGIDQWGHLHSYVTQTLVCLPIVAYWVESSRHFGGAGALVRVSSSVLMLAFALCLLDEGIFAAALTLFGSSAGFLAWSVYRRYREPTVFAATIVALSFVQLLYLSFADLHFNGWLILAAGGLVLVVGASAVERYGQRMLVSSRTAWTTVRQWS